MKNVRNTSRKIFIKKSLNRCSHLPTPRFYIKKTLTVRDAVLRGRGRGRGKVCNRYLPNYVFWFRCHCHSPSVVLQ